MRIRLAWALGITLSGLVTIGFANGIATGFELAAFMGGSMVVGGLMALAVFGDPYRTDPPESGQPVEKSHPQAVDKFAPHSPGNGGVVGSRFHQGRWS